MMNRKINLKLEVYMAEEDSNSMSDTEIMTRMEDIIIKTNDSIIQDIVYHDSNRR